MNKIKSDIPMLLQCLRGSIICTALEFAFGVIFNIWLGCNFWHYGNSFFGLGQIDIWHSLAWFALTPFAIWLDDYVRWIFYSVSELELENIFYITRDGRRKGCFKIKMYSLGWIYLQVLFFWRRVDWSKAKYRLV